MNITTSHFSNGSTTAPPRQQQPQSYHQTWQQQQREQQGISNGLVNENTCSRCASSGRMCYAVHQSSASSASGATPTGVCAECGHGFMYHTASNNGGHSMGNGYNGYNGNSNHHSISHANTGRVSAPPQDRKNDETRSNGSSSKTSKSRGWRVLASAVRASKACKPSTADAAKTTNGAAGKGLFYEPLVDNVNGGGFGTQSQWQRQQDDFQRPETFYPPDGGLLQQQDRGHRAPVIGEGNSSSSAPGREKGSPRDSAASQSAAAAWENLQLMSGLSLGDAVTVVSGAPSM